MRTPRPLAAAICGLAALFAASSALAQPANDLCTNAQVVPAPAFLAGTSSGATGSDLSPLDYQCGIDDTADVWYRIPAGAFPRQFRVEVTTDDEFFTPNVAAYTTCPSSPTDGFIACYSVPALIGFFAPAQQDIYLRVAGDDNYGAPFAIDIRWTDITAPGPGDDCAAPIPITPASTRTGSTVGYSGAASSACGFFDNVDIWFRLDIPAGQGGAYVIDTFGSAFDTTLSVYSSCPVNPADGLIACDDDLRAYPDVFGNPPVRTSQVGVLLDPGSYLIRVAGSIASTGAYQLTVSSRSEPIPGDFCHNAVPLAPDSTASGTTTGLTGFNPYRPPGSVGSCFSNDRFDAWFSFSAPRDGIYAFRLQGTGGMSFPVVRVFEACGGRQLHCEDSGQGAAATTYVQLSAGVPVLVRVAAVNGVTGPYTLDSISPALNDECVNAIAITGSSITGSTENSYALINDWLNFGVFNGVWYSYTAPQDGWYQFSTDGSPFDTVVAVASDCDGDLLVWNNDIATQATPALRTSRPQAFLTAGQRCVIQVSGYRGDSGPFTLTITRQPSQPAPPANDDCVFATPITPGFSASVDARRATNEPFTLPACFIAGTNDITTYGVWFKYTAVGNGIATFAETGSAAVGVRVYTSTTGDCTGLTTTPALNRADLVCAADTASWRVSDGETYYVFVYSFAGDQPVSNYAVNFALAANTGNCCVTAGAACAVLTKAACLAAGGTYLGDSAPCVKPGGAQSARTPILDQPVNGNFFEPQITTYPVVVSGVSSPLATIEVQLDVSHFRAGNLSLALTSPSGAEVTLAGRVTNSAACWDYRYYFLDGVYTFTDAAALSFSQGIFANAGFPDYTLDSGAYAAWDCTPGRINLNTALAGQPANGTWTITAREFSSFPDSGVIRAARIYINGGNGDPCAPACIADFNASGAITVQDIFDFLTAYFTNTITADVNQSGTLTVQDIFDFLTRYFQGC